MPLIEYATEGFPARVLSNGVGDLDITWGELLWAAITVGRPNRYHVFRHGTASFYEAMFRLSVMRMALEEGPGSRLYRTAAARTLDPTEKGAINYFVSMAVCKLFAARLLDTPWLIHLDAFRPILNPVLAGRSRPDLVGQESGTYRWHAFECKGRSDAPDDRTKDAAKAQAQRLVEVDGLACASHIGAIAYLSGETLKFFWRDPSPSKVTPIVVQVEERAWEYYYGPTAEILRSGVAERMSSAGLSATLPEIDLTVSAHGAIAGLLLESRWSDVREAARDAVAEFRDAGFQADGLAVHAGRSWESRIG